MSILSLPEPTATTHERGIAALAEYAARFELDHGGSHLRTALLAALIASTHDLTPGEAIDLAREDAFDDRVREAGREADRLMGEARRRREAQEYGEFQPCYDHGYVDCGCADQAEGRVSR